MSVLSSARVWERSKQAGTDLLMLLAIADFADDDGRAYPSVPTLARKCRTTPRHTNRILAMLRESGELEIRTNEGPKGTNLYRLVFERMTNASAPLTNTSPRRMGPKPLTPTSSPPDAQVPKPLTPTSDEPSLNHQGTVKEPSRKPRSSDSTALLHDVDPQRLADWEKVRKAKRAGPITSTVADGVRREAKQAGLTVDEALTICCERGWQSFKAAWVVEPARAGLVTGAPPRQSVVDRQVATMNALTGRTRRAAQSFSDIDYTEGVHDGIVQG